MCSVCVCVDTHWPHWYLVGIFYLIYIFIYPAVLTYFIGKTHKLVVFFICFAADTDEDHLTMMQNVTLKCLESDFLCNEFYLQLVKQTTDHPGRLWTVHRVIVTKHHHRCWSLGVTNHHHHCWSLGVTDHQSPSSLLVIGCHRSPITIIVAGHWVSPITNHHHLCCQCWHHYGGVGGGGRFSYFRCGIL